MNSYDFLGRLTAEPEIKTSQDGSTTIARFRVALDRKYHKDGEPTADFIPCIAFNKTAQFIERHFHKGNRICGSGELRSGSYQKEGKTIYTLDVIVDSVEFCEPKLNEPTVMESIKDNTFTDALEDEGLPFN